MKRLEMVQKKRGKERDRGRGVVWCLREKDNVRILGIRGQGRKNLMLKRSEVKQSMYKRDVMSCLYNG